MRKLKCGTFCSCLQLFVVFIVKFCDIQPWTSNSSTKIDNNKIFIAILRLRQSQINSYIYWLSWVQLHLDRDDNFAVYLYISLCHVAQNNDSLDKVILRKGAKSLQILFCLGKWILNLQWIYNTNIWPNDRCSSFNLKGTITSLPPCCFISLYPPRSNWNYSQRLRSHRQGLKTERTLFVRSNSVFDYWIRIRSIRNF